jgi:hypothetical protein
MNKLSLFHSFLLAICLSVMSWVAYKTAANGESIAGMRATLDAVKDAGQKSDTANVERHLRLERKIDDMVPRRDYDSKMLSIETEQHKSEIHLREIDLEILKLKQKLP